MNQFFSSSLRHNRNAGAPRVDDWAVCLAFYDNPIGALGLVCAWSPISIVVHGTGTGTGTEPCKSLTLLCVFRRTAEPYPRLTHIRHIHAHTCTQINQREGNVCRCAMRNLRYSRVTVCVLLQHTDTGLLHANSPCCSLNTRHDKSNQRQRSDPVGWVGGWLNTRRG
jgi:hypothetical protein